MLEFENRNTEGQRKLQEEQAESNILSKYGFSCNKAQLLELKKHCMSDNTEYFIDTFLMREMELWRKKNEGASAEEERKAITVLIETVSNDYIYGRINKENMPHKKEGEEKLFEGDISQEDYYREYIETHEPMVNQLEKIRERMLGKKEETVNEEQKVVHQKVQEVMQPVFA